MPPSPVPSRSERTYPPRRHGKHTVYVRPAEAQKAYEALDTLIVTVDHWMDDEDLIRLRDKLYAIEWESDALPREGQDG